MKNIEQLREDLKVFERYAEMNPSLHSHCDDLARKIAALEAAADPWLEAKRWADSYRGSGHAAYMTRKIVEYIDHLTAEVERLTKRVAELGDKIARQYDPRVLRRALEIAHGEIESINGNKYFPRETDPIGSYLDQARHELESEGSDG